MTEAEKQLLPWEYLLSAPADLLRGSEPGGNCKTPPGAWCFFQNLWQAGVRSRPSGPAWEGPRSGGSGVWARLCSKGPRA